MLSLPPDLLLLVCEELGNRLDFRTLFSCALTGKDLVGSALLCLYRIHSQSPIINSDGNDTEFSGGQNLTYQARMDIQKTTVSKWALQWNSIVRSSLGKTAYPYCLYIRTLDLRNLADLLEDPLFRETALNKFFAADMAIFLRGQETPMKKKTRAFKASYERINVPVVLDLVGESITNFVGQLAGQNRCAAALEDLSGNISGAALPRWVGRLSRLKGITLWDGAALNESVARAIASNCHNFDDLTFFTCERGEIDHDMASFFGGLRPNSLRSFSALSARAIGPETLRSLNHHALSLKALKLSGLNSGALKKLSLLQGCKALEALDIQDAEGLIDLEATDNDIFLDVVSWLGKCKQIRELHMSRLVSGPAILTRVCLNNDIRLRELEVVGYRFVDNADFHKAISHQTSLEYLKLKADPEDSFRDDIDILVSSICQLTKLKHLNILATSDYFRSSEILLLASSLENLEELWFGGYDVTDDIWHALSSLHNLRSLNVHAVSSFSLKGILAFISRLKDTNQGLLLSIMSQLRDHDLGKQEQTIIQQSIAAQVDGQFEFVLYREAESEDDTLSE